MIKIGIMSFAHMHAYSYAACINALPNAELVAVWDDVPKRGKAAAKDYETTFIKDVNKFLDTKMDGVIICSENNKHRAMVDVAASAGKWILCEKPLAPNVKDTKTIMKVCADNGVGLGTAFPCRYVPTLIEARRQVQNGDFGEILAASCTNHGQFPGGWFAEEAFSGGGATMDHTVHVVDVLRWILEKEFTQVYCEGDNLLHKREIETDDLGSLNLEMEGGVQISHLASWSRPKSFATWGDVTIEFIGTKGVLNVDAFNQKINVYDDKNMRYEWAPWGGNADLGLVADFVESIEEQRQPSVTGEDGLRATEVSVAACKSMRTHKVVQV